MSKTEQILFFSDLDRTLIYSHRIVLPGEKRVVERLNGKDQSFMTEFTYRELKSRQWIKLIPITTRTREQYERIWVFSGDICPEYALICNGGTLLVNGIEDPIWQQETRELIGSDRKEMKRIRLLAEKYAGVGAVRDVSDMFFYLIHAAPEWLCTQLGQEADHGSVHIFYVNNKVYCMPASLQKGSALLRLKKRLPQMPVVAAGDSVMDLSMLRVADQALYPEELCEAREISGGQCIHDSVFSDGIMRYLIDNGR